MKHDKLVRKGVALAAIALMFFSVNAAAFEPDDMKAEMDAKFDSNFGSNFDEKFDSTDVSSQTSDDDSSWTYRSVSQTENTDDGTDSTTRDTGDATSDTTDDWDTWQNDLDAQMNTAFDSTDDSSQDTTQTSDRTTDDSTSDSYDGSSDSTSSDSLNEDNTDDSTTDSTSDSTSDTTASSSSLEDRTEEHLSQMINQERRQRGLNSLTHSSALRRTADIKSDDMADRNYFSHTSPSGDNFRDLYNENGVNCRAGGENIARTWYNRNVRTDSGSTVNYDSAEELADGIRRQWMTSSAHRDAILRDRYNSHGLGVEITSSGRVYATEHFCT